MAEPLEFTIAIEDFNPFLLDRNVEPGTKEFQNAVLAYYTKQFAPLGGSTIIAVDDEKIHVQWIPDAVSKNPFDYVLKLLQSGEYQKAVPLLETFLDADPDDVDTLYNLGMALSDMGRLEEAKKHLSRAVEVMPDHVNALVALGVAYLRSGDQEAGAEVLQRAAEADPENGYAHRNLGAALTKLGRSDEAEQHLREAARLMPLDQASLFGLAQILETSGDEQKLSEADKLYIRLIDLDSTSQIAEFARRSRSGLAQRGFRQATGGTPRMDAVMYCLSALQKFAAMKPQEVQSVVFEIAMLGMNGLDTNDSTPKYKLRSMSGNFTGLQLVSMMYVGFKQIDPSMDVGFDLSNEYSAAQQLFSGKAE
jgi:tetratricopeptide (TPR) repeat protein